MIKRINIQNLLNTAKKFKEFTADDVPRYWSKREIVDLIVYILELKKKNA